MMVAPRFGGFQKETALGLWIHDRLEEYGEDYIENMWREYSKEVSGTKLKRRRRIVKDGVILGYREYYKPPSYHSFAKYVYALRQAGLIEFTREEEVTGRYRQAIPRHYFRIKPGAELDPKWNNPMLWAFLK